MPLADPLEGTDGSVRSGPLDLESPMITHAVDRGYAIPILLAAALFGVCAVSLGA